ncbi:hypothetical protein LTR85_000579 [Meristemomyces frigidus]|nr:hypothetical protein LTR85_000579 [Meristemomyces frigidus]
MCEIAAAKIRTRIHALTPSSHTTQHPLTVANVASFNILESVYSTLGNLSTLLPTNFNSSAAIAHASKAIEQLFTGAPPAPPPHTANFWQDKLNDAITSLTDFAAGRTTLENTSILLALCTFFVLAMSWGTRLGNLGRFSPFTRSPPQGSSRVSDADFSYITADDLRNHNADSGASHSHHHHQRAESPVDYGPSRDTDQLLLKNKKREYPVHFPAYSIAKGELTVGHVRDQAAKKTGTNDPRRIKLLFRGKNLKDDARTCKAEGLRDGDQLMLTIADSMASASASDDDDDDDESGYADGGEQTADGEGRRRRNRGKKSKRKAKREQVSGTATPAEQAPAANLGVPHSQPSTRAPSPRPTPTTAIGKIEAIREKLGEYLPQAAAFQQSPPADPAKKDFEHKKLSETILAQVLLKLDAVETEGDPEARQRRKDLVRETQNVLQDLDAVMKR